MTRFYLDTSVAVHILLGSQRARAWFDSLNDPADRLIASRLLQTELIRVLRREGLPLDRRHAILDQVDVVPVDHAVLQAAESITEHLRTLDAVHLGSAQRAAVEDLVIVTHDQAMASVAQHLGFETLDPVA